MTFLSAGEAKNRSRLLGLLSCLALSACQPVYLTSLFHPSSSPAPFGTESKAAKASLHPPTPPHAGSSSSQRHVKQTAEKVEKAGAPAENSVNEAATTPDLRLAPAGNPTGEGSTGQGAEHAVDEAARQLTTVDRSKLSGQNATDYDLVAGFIKGAREALQEKDFVRAQSLAEKASALAAQLGERIASPR